ncbi:MAG: glutamyl-tRNA reductase [Thermoguttaceae bacterium]|nr:glutamyl-tRNA reductase [Thermoguttaceae bacterium]
MKICMFGIDHKTASVAVRESFAFSADETRLFLDGWHASFSDVEAILLSTCNRTELYLSAQEDSFPGDGAVASFLTDAAGRRGETPPKPDQLHILLGGDAVRHLFSVAASLESMVLGEPQILAQIKEAYNIASEEGTAGIALHSLFQNALKAAKRVSVETELFRHRISLPAVAVSDFALELFEKLSDKRTLVLGAGEMAEETLRYLKDAGEKEIVVANRSREKAETLADRFGGRAADWNARVTELAAADLVIAATGAGEPIVTADDYRSIASKRSDRPLFMVDLSVPRNLDERLGRFPNVYLYSIDDLEEACQRNRKAREREIPKANRVIAQETESFLKELRLRDSGELIGELRRRWNTVKDEEVQRLLNKCGPLPSETESEIRYAFDRLINKLLHAPMRSLRDESQEGKPTRLLEAMFKLFRFQDKQQ